MNRILTLDEMVQRLRYLASEASNGDPRKEAVLMVAAVAAMNGMDSPAGLLFIDLLNEF